MKRSFMVIALVLAFLLAFSGVALADTSVTVNFANSNPNIYIQAYKPGPGGNWSHTGTAVFSLTGTGTATGQVTASDLGRHGFGVGNNPANPYGWITGQPAVYTSNQAGIVLKNGNFNTLFAADSYQIEDVAYFSSAHWSEQSLKATGVGSSGFTVHGDATAAYGTGGERGGFTQSGMAFSGQLEKLEVYASKEWSTRQGLNRNAWDESKFQGASFSAQAGTGAAAIQVEGSTDARAYWGSGTTVYNTLATQGLGYQMQTGSAIDYLHAWVDTTYSVERHYAEPGIIQGFSGTWLGHPYNPWP